MKTYQDQLEQLILEYLVFETRLHKTMTPEQLDILERLRYRRQVAALLKSPQKSTLDQSA